MTEEILNAAITRLKSKALEQYGLLKQAYQSPADENTVDKICHHALALVEYEGAMLTLQQYAPALKQQPATQVQEEAEEEAVEEETQPETEQAPIRGEELEKRSATYRKSVKGRKKSEPKTKKKSE
jgi:hypothetical protein